jgi:inhibitor of KinA
VSEGAASQRAWRVSPAGEAGLRVHLGGEISDEVFGRVMGALTALDQARPAGVVDVLPGYASLLVLFDPRRLAPDDARAFVEGALAHAPAAPAARGRLVEIPVLYDPAVAPDLVALAAEKAISVEELVRRHAAPRYRCHLLGFRPGFPFLGGLDPVLAASRLPTPRLSVPAGSVGIGGQQTGVYPGAGPGGWRLIGRTPLRLFDPGRPRPFLIEAGDAVRFVPIDGERFRALAATAPGSEG